MEEEKKNNKKNAVNSRISKITKINISIIVILIILMIILKIVDSGMNKIVINSMQLPQSSLSMLQEKDGVEYIVIEDFIENLSSKLYSLYNDRYITDKSKKDQGGDYFYIDSIYEAVQFNKNDDKYIKHIKYDDLDRKVDEKGNKILTEEEKQSNEGAKKRELTKMDKIILNQEQFTLKHPVEEFNGKLALSLEDAKYAFNIRFDRTKNGKILKIYTIDYLEKVYANSLGNYNVDSNYQNRRAIIDGYMFLADPETSKRGVYNLGNSGIDKNVIPIKYDDVRYAQNNRNVYCIKDELVELKNLDTGNTIINAGEYTSISVYSQEKQLYLVADRTKKYGLIGHDGQEVVPTDFDIIGYDTSFFPEEPEDAGKILFDNLIPVFKDDKWGFYYADSNKEVLIGQKFVSLGCKKMEYIENSSSEKGQVELPDDIIENLAKIGFKVNGDKLDRQVAYIRGFTTDKNDLMEGESVFTIPEEANTGYSGVVVRSEEGLYGIISSQAKKDVEFILPPNFDRIYKKMENGVAKYYAQYGSNVLELNKGNSSVDTNSQNNTTIPANGMNTNNNTSINTNGNNIVTDNTSVTSSSTSINTNTSENSTNDPATGVGTEITGF